MIFHHMLPEAQFSLMDFEQPLGVLSMKEQHCEIRGCLQGLI